MLKALGSKISNMTFPCDMVDMGMVDMDLEDMDMVDMDMVDIFFLTLTTARFLPT